MFKGIFSIVGGKWGVIAIIAAALTIAGLTGYIKYQSAKHAAEEIELRGKLRDARRDIRERDRVIKTQQEEEALFNSRVETLARAMESLQSIFAQNSQQRRRDVDNMTRPRPRPGQSADTKEMEDAANNGMNGLFNELEAITQPTPSAGTK